MSALSIAEVAIAEDAPDADLVRAAQAGDGEALLRLLGRYEGSVAGVCRRYVQGPDVADASQEIFARVIDHLHDLREPGAFGGWLHAIARNVARDLSTQGGRVVALPDTLDAACPAPTPDDHLIAAEEAASLHARLAQLSDRDARALWMRDAIGLPVPEVADELGLTEGSTRVMLTRARRRLRDTFAGVAALLGVWRVELHERIGQHAPVLHPSWAAAVQAGAVALALAVPVGSGLTPTIGPDPATAVTARDGSSEPPRTSLAPTPAARVPDAPAPPPLGAPADERQPAPPTGPVTEAGPLTVGGPPPEEQAVTVQVGSGDDEISIDLYPGNLMDTGPASAGDLLDGPHGGSG